MDKELKVVWLCHFSNDEIKAILKPRKNLNEYALWMPKAIKTIEGDNRFDLYVVMAYPYISGIKKFELRGVKYICFNPFIPLLGYSWPKWFRWDYWTDFAKTKRVVKKIVDEIHPDIVHLFGAENPDYSQGIIPLFNKYPTILTVQGFNCKSEFATDWMHLRRNVLERRVIEGFKVAFYESKQLREEIKLFNPNLEFFWHFYGSYEINIPPMPKTKSYDIVFFARINRDKGIVDLLDAIKLIKKDIPSVKVCIIGWCSSKEFEEYAMSLGISDNIEWTGFMPTIDDVHKKAIQAKVSVLPTYHDVNPGTIIESMFMGIPVVAYATDNLPEINENGEAISLVEKGNVKSLAKAIKRILDSEELQKYYKETSIQRAKEMYAPSNEKLANCLLAGYHRSIEIFKNV